MAVLVFGRAGGHVEAIFAWSSGPKSRAPRRAVAVLVGRAASSSDGRTGPAAEVREWPPRLHAFRQLQRREAGHDRPIARQRRLAAPEARALQAADRRGRRGGCLSIGAAARGRDVGPATVPLDRRPARPRPATPACWSTTRCAASCTSGRRNGVQRRGATAGAGGRAAPHTRLLRFQLGNAALASAAGQPMSTAPSAAVRDHLAWFHDALVEPLMLVLDHARLVIVPHDVLHALLFHAVGREGRALIDTFVVSYARARACTTTRGALRAGATRGPWCWVCLMRSPRRLATRRRTSRSSCLLLHARSSALGAAATRAFLDTHAPGARYVHVATHGRFRQDNPLFSSIRLADQTTLSGCRDRGVAALGGSGELERLRHRPERRGRRRRTAGAHARPAVGWRTGRAGVPVGRAR